MDVREKLVEIVGTALDGTLLNITDSVVDCVVDALIANVVTVQEWTPVSEPPKENDYYLCVIFFSAVGNKKKYIRKILFWEDNVWIEKPNSFRIEKPLYWTTMLEMPQPPKGE